MVAFDADGKLRKFASVGEIIEHYYCNRLAAYEMRRQHQIGGLEAQEIETDARMRFIQAVLDERIVIARASDVSIVSAIRKEKLPPISSPTEPESIKAYEYLLRMRMDRIKASAVAELEEELVSMREKIAALQGTKADTLWMTDLAEFETMWIKYANEREETMAATPSGPIQKKKRALKVVGSKQKD